jgi:hypothetical protein
LLEQLDQQRISALVEDQKTGVDAVLMAFEFDLDRVRVAAEIFSRLEQGDLRLRTDRPGGRKPGDPRSDDRHAALRQRPPRLLHLA